MLRGRALISILVAALFLLVGAEDAQAAVAHASIVGGSPVSIGEFPFMAYVEMGTPGEEGACSGTVVSQNMILTAGHCLLNRAGNELRNPETIQVLVGTENIGGGGRWYPVQRVSFDPLDAGPGWHDAGLIEVSGFLRTPTIALSDAAPVPGMKIATLGWGDTQSTATEDSEYGSETLLAGESVVQSAKWCLSHSDGLYFSKSDLCAIDAPSYRSTTCYGDSGGPEVAADSEGAYIEMGITSLGTSETCSTLEPEIDTLASAEVGWVEREVARNEPTLPTLTRSAALADVFDVLRTGEFRRHFSGRYGFTDGCSRVENSKMQCYPKWGQSGDDYYGSATIYLAWEKGEAVWGYQYRLSWINDYCYYEGPHPGRCKVWTRRSS